MQICVRTPSEIGQPKQVTPFLRDGESCGFHVSGRSAPQQLQHRAHISGQWQNLCYLEPTDDSPLKKNKSTLVACVLCKHVDFRVSSDDLVRHHRFYTQMSKPQSDIPLPDVVAIYTYKGYQSHMLTCMILHPIQAHTFSKIFFTLQVFVFLNIGIYFPTLKLQFKMGWGSLSTVNKHLTLHTFTQHAGSTRWATVAMAATASTPANSTPCSFNEYS